MSIKEGLSEKVSIPENIERNLGHDRPGPNQKPKKPAGESASKGGKKFNIQ